MLFALWASTLGCNDVGFAVVSIEPIYGWVDGCNSVKISGHGFGSDVSATIGGNDVTDLVLPNKELDKGFTFSGVAPGGSHGYADVTVTTGGQSSTLTGTGSYYFVECPGLGYAERVSPEAVGVGTEVTVEGCGLDTALVFARLVDADGEAAGPDLPLAQACRTARATFAAPALPDGTYILELVDAAGTVLWGGPCPPRDSADTAYSCSETKLSYGEATP